MGFSIPSFSSIAQSVGTFVGEAAGKAASAVTQQAPAAQTPAAPPKPPTLDGFDPAPAKAPVNCGGTTTQGAPCLPEGWGNNKGGGGNPTGGIPSGR